MDGAKWARLFSRLERAVSIHRADMLGEAEGAQQFALTAADERLYAAYEKIMREAGPPPPPEPMPGQTNIIDALEAR